MRRTMRLLSRSIGIAGLLMLIAIVIVSFPSALVPSFAVVLVLLPPYVAIVGTAILRQRRPIGKGVNDQVSRNGVGKARMALLWLPIAFATFVLIFFPVASHLLHPQSHYLRYYRVPIPWTLTVLSSLGPPREDSFVFALVGTNNESRHGITPFLRGTAFRSAMLFEGAKPTPDELEYGRRLRIGRRRDSTELLHKAFLLGRLTFDCYQYVPANRWHVAREVQDFREVTCETRPDVRKQNLNAWFYGDANDIPTFYHVIEGLVPVN